MTRFWHRRITEATMFVSFVVLALYAGAFFKVTPLINELVQFDWRSAAIAFGTLIVAVILYFYIPKSNVKTATFDVYACLVSTVASLIMTSGEASSPFIGVWVAVSVFAGVFGWRGFALVLGVVVGYDIYAFLKGAAPESLIIITAASLAPIIASFIIWHSRSGKDIEREKAYDALASELSHEANKSDTVIGAINDGVVSIDKAGVIQLINPAAQRIIGWGQNDAVGLSYKSVVKLNDQHDTPITEANDPVAQVLLTNQEVHSEDFSIQTEGGKKVLLSLIVSPIGKPSTGAIMVFRDMTKEKSEEREQAEFISTASHEMRTPVASIEGYLGLALNPATAQIDEKARDYIEKAHESARHLGRLFQDLLDVSKAEDGRMTNNPGVIDVSGFVEDVVEGLKPKALEKNLRFIFKPALGESSNDRTITPVYYAHVDGDHLREVVANLVENAIKYTLQGDVVIDVGGDESHVVVSVQDSGIGIPTEDIPHLFQKFYRVDNSDTREIGGTGLGLYLCRQLAELMGGQIKVESEYKKGSTFMLELPRIDHTEATRLMDAAAAAQALADQTATQQTPSPVAPQPTEFSQPVTTQATMPTAQTTPSSTQTSAAAVAAPPESSAAAATLRAIQPPSNVPISQIEQNPTAFMTAGRAPIQIPVRDPNDTKA